MIKSLQAKLPKNKGIIIVSPENRRYFTGFDSSDGILIVTKDDALFLTDSRYIEAAQKKITSCRVEELKRLSEQTEEIAKQIDISYLMTESEKLSVAELKRLRKTFGNSTLSTVGADEIISSLRSVKTENEISSVMEAQRIAKKAFRHILSFIKEGVTEKELALELDYFMLKNGAEAVSFETIAVSGKKSSMPHGVPDENKIRSGDFITFDFGAVKNGYHSDMTRTVGVGRISDKQKKVYSTVLSAQKNALDSLRENLKCSEADLAARSVISDAGFGEYFRHSTGHGVGVEIHEAPNLSPLSKAVLKKGNIVTVEPGIYIPDEFGVRIEDMALITESGCVNLTHTPKELIIC